MFHTAYPLVRSWHSLVLQASTTGRVLHVQWFKAPRYLQVGSCTRATPARPLASEHSWPEQRIGSSSLAREKSTESPENPRRKWERPDRAGFGSGVVFLHWSRGFTMKRASDD